MKTLNKLRCWYYRWRVKARWPGADLYSMSGGQTWDGIIYDIHSASWTKKQLAFPIRYAPESEWMAWQVGLMSPDAAEPNGVSLFAVRWNVNYWTANLLVFTPWGIVNAFYYAVEERYGLVQSGFVFMAREARTAAQLREKYFSYVYIHGVMPAVVANDPFTFVPERNG